MTSHVSSLLVNAIRWMRQVCTNSAGMIALILVVCPLSVKAQCTGNNGSIADYDSPVHRQLSTQLANLDGTYCSEAEGASQLNFGTIDGGQTCSISITRAGQFSLTVGGRTVSWNQSVGMGVGTLKHGVKDYRILGGTADVTAVLDVLDNRLVMAATISEIPNTPDAFQYLVCNFGYVSSPAGVPARSYFASGNSLPNASVGTFNGLQNNGSMSCKLTVRATGEASLSFTSSEGTKTSYGELRGRYYDSVTEYTIKTTAANANSWNDFREVVYGPSIEIDASGRPTLARFTSGNAEYTCPVGDGMTGVPSCSGTSCYPELKGIGEASCSATVGNPINVISGNKFQKEIDYSPRAGVPLQFTRYYNSHSSTAIASIGSNWRTNFDWSLQVDPSKIGALLHKPDGQIVRFENLASKWISYNDKAYAMRPALATDSPGSTWVVTYDGITISFGAMGDLKELKYVDGRKITVVRDRLQRLEKAVDHAGRALTFGYDAQNRIQTMKDPTGEIYTYRYDLDRLSHVERPHTNGRVTREYKYENALFPQALTGIVDENGIRFATYGYDEFGRAYSTEHAGGVNKYTVRFGEEQSVVTDPINSDRIYRIAPFNDEIKVTGVDQPAGAGCDAAFRVSSHDGDGDLKSSTNFNGVVTNYEHDKLRRLTTAKIEAVGRLQQRTTATEWHPIFRLPKRIASPKRLIIFDYYPDGKLKTRSVQSSKDETGAQRFSAVLSGPVSVWNYTYNSQGRLETVTGPRLGGIEKTIYTYDLITGNLLTIQNAVGHITTLGEYDANGRVRLVTDPNGLITRLTYTPQGLLETATASDGTRVLKTTYEYDYVGQLKRVTMPDGSYLRYDYDDAHRLTDIGDSAGNTIHYVLNGLGSREKEEVRDPSGTLKRRVERQFDSLNRVKFETGGAL